jgi:hypothetical protein
MQIIQVKFKINLFEINRLIIPAIKLALRRITISGAQTHRVRI